MPRSSPVTPQVRARILDLHERGVGRNDIARIVELSGRTVSNIVKAAGREFSSRQAAKATEIRRADLAALRASLAVKLVEKAHALVDDMDRPFLAFNFGGKDNTYEEHELERPPTGDIRNLMQSAVIAAKESRELVRFDNDGSEGAAAVDAWLAHMAGQGPS